MTEARKYTAEWVEARARQSGADWLDHHDCGLCGVMVGFVITPEDVRFRSGCGCSWSPSRPSSFGEIADWLAMQRSDEIRDRIMAGFKCAGKPVESSQDLGAPREGEAKPKSEPPQETAQQ